MRKILSIGEELSRSPSFLAPCRVDISNFVFYSLILSVTVWPQRCALQTLYLQLPALTQSCLDLAHDWCNGYFICCRLTYICSTVPHSYVIWIHHAFLILPIRAWHTHWICLVPIKRLHVVNHWCDNLYDPCRYIKQISHLCIFLCWCPFRTRTASPFLLPNVVDNNQYGAPENQYCHCCHQHWRQDHHHQQHYHCWPVGSCHCRFCCNIGLEIRTTTKCNNWTGAFVTSRHDNGIGASVVIASGSRHGCITVGNIISSI